MTQSTEAAGVATPNRSDAVIEAKDIVAHANWVFANFIQLDNPVRVVPSSEVTFA